MLTCVCRPVSGNLPKMPPSMLPMPKVTPATAAATSFASASFASAAAATTASSLTASASTVGRQATIVVTAEPKLNVPGRLTSAELRAMALRQQQQIDSQHQLLATKEQRLRFLKTQEVRNAVANAEGERLRRLRERVEAQESKLRRLRALRGQVDLQKTYNVTLSNDLDSIRALFSEKEKELSLAVAKVEALTRQLEDLRRDRRCPINLLAGGGGSGGGGVTAAGASAAGQTLPPQASRELEKLRRELMYRNQLSLQQDARLHLQREALQQRQAELRSVDQRIYELQTRLQRKKAANVQVVQQHQQQPPHHPLHGPTATTTTGSHLMAHHQQQQQHHHQQQQQQHQMQSLHEAHAQQQHHQQQHQQHQQHQQQQQQQHQQKLQHLQQQHQQQQQVSNNPDFQTNLAKQGVAALKQQLLQKHATATSAAAAAATNNNTTSQPPLPHHNNQPQQQGQSHNGKFSNHIGNREPNRHMQRGNVAAVEPYIHTPQKSSITPPSSALYLGGGGGPGNHQLKHAAATANTNQQNQLIQDMTHVKLQLTNAHPPTAATATANTAASAPAQSHNAAPFFSGESDESKLAKKLLSASLAAKNAAAELHKPKASPEIDSSHHIYAEVGPKKRDLVKEAPASAHESATNGSGAPLASTIAATPTASKIPKSIVTSISASAVISKLNSNNNASSPSTTTTTTSVSAPRDHGEKKSELSVASETLSEKNTHQLTVHSMPLGTANKSVATAIAAAESQSAATNLTKPPPHKLQHPSGHSNASNTNLAVPPRKPISSVAPTSVSSSSSIPKMITYSPKVNRVAPNVVSTGSSSSSTTTANTTSNSQASNNNSQAPNAASANDVRPALPPKPNKMLTPPEATADSTNNNSNNKKATESSSSLATLNINDNLPIKAKPLTIRKQPMSEQPRLKSSTSLAIKPLASQGTRQGRDMPSATSLLFPDSTRQAKEADSERRSPPEQQQQHSPNNNNNMQNSMDELDKIESGGAHADLEVSPESMKKRQRASSVMQNGNMGGGGPVTSGPATGSTATTTSSTTTKSSNGKPKLARRVSFDPLALLLDASLEGELELVKKTAMQVANPSAANDEGITALHNAICAGHFDIVKFLVEFGCDVNAQDSDGWTPLHCAASCNNLSMVKFLVENGACLFAATLSDHETPAEKCEEDEEGFDGCSEYLYSIQEKLGILHNGEVYAVFSYEAQNSDELTFNVNDRLMILRKGDDSENEWWWAKNSSDEEGYVPRNLLGLYPRVPPQSSNFND